MADSVSSGGWSRALDVLGFAVSATSRAVAYRWIERSLGDPWDRRCRHLVTLNPEYVMAAKRDPAFAAAIHAADLATADGAGVAVAVRLVHGEEIERVTGVEIVEFLAQISASANAPLYLLGARAGVATATASRLRERFADARIAGWWSDGTPNPRDDAETLRRIRESAARIVLVAYGAPGQVMWIERNRAALEEAGVRLALGVGGSFDYLSGMTPRPPEWVRRAGFEWLFRLVREPGRWRRQRVLPVFAVRVLIASVRNRLRFG